MLHIIKEFIATLITMSYQLMQHLLNHCRNNQSLIFHAYYVVVLYSYKDSISILLITPFYHLSQTSKITNLFFLNQKICTKIHQFGKKKSQDIVG